MEHQTGPCDGDDLLCAAVGIVGHFLQGIAEMSAEVGVELEGRIATAGECVGWEFEVYDVIARRKDRSGSDRSFLSVGMDCDRASDAITGFAGLGDELLMCFAYRREDRKAENWRRGRL